MSRRGGYPDDDGYDDRRTNVSRRPRRERKYNDVDVDVDVDVRQSRYDGPEPQRYDPPPRSRRPETMVKENDTRTERASSRQPEFLREDYGRNPNAGPLVVREERREEDDYVSRAPTRRRSLESVRSQRPPPPRERGERDEFVFKEQERDRGGPPYPQSQRGSFGEQDRSAFRERERSRGPPPNRGGASREDIDIDIRIREDERQGRRPPPPRDDYREEDRFSSRGGGRPPPSKGGGMETEEITFTHRESSRPPPNRREVDREEISFRETRSPPPREPPRGRESRKEEIDIDIDIREGSAQPPPPRQRSMSRGNLVRKDHEEWVVRRRRTPSPSPPPPPRDFEREEIIIRQKERSPSPIPEPPREPTPEPAPPPPPPQEPPIYRPPIIQEVITHHRHIDHGVERARSPSPAPPPAPAAPSPPPKEREEDLEISIRRQGMRNGKAYDEEITFEHDRTERDIARQPSRAPSRNVSQSRDMVRQRSASRSRAPSPARNRRYDDDVSAEADYYNRQVASRAYPGEAWNGATKKWELVDVPPGTERVRMDGVGGGRQEITWERYNGQRRGKFYTDDRTYGDDWGNGSHSPAPSRPRDDYNRETRFESSRSEAPAQNRRKEREKMWTEVAKDLVIREAIEEKGYEYEETEEFFYVLEYLRYEDVLRLVETTEDIRRERRERLREIQWEREQHDHQPKMLPPPVPQIPPPPIRGRGGGGGYNESIHEHDYEYRRRGYR